MTIKQGLKMSAIIDKLDIKINNPKATSEEIGSDLIMQLVTKAYKAENEIYNFVAVEKECTTEQAAEIDLVEFIKELISDSGFMGFFKSAVR